MWRFWSAFWANFQICRLFEVAESFLNNILFPDIYSDSVILKSVMACNIRVQGCFLRIPMSPVSNNNFSLCTVCPNNQEPIFHNVPPTTQKIYQSQVFLFGTPCNSGIIFLSVQAYMRYIEGLNSESNSMCDWNKELSSSEEIFQSRIMEDGDSEDLPTWLDNIINNMEGGARTNNNNTLFALRDFMLQETLSVVKFSWKYLWVIWVVAHYSGGQITLF